MIFVCRDTDYMYFNLLRVTTPGMLSSHKKREWKKRTLVASEHRTPLIQFIHMQQGANQTRRCNEAAAVVA